MEEIKRQLKNDDFFKGKDFELYSIQDYGRKSKFKVKMGENYYTLILTEERISPYIHKMDTLGEDFKQIIGFQYLSEDKTILVLDYFGNNKGIDLVKCDSELDIGNYDTQLKNILDSIHSKKQEYVDFSDYHFPSWKEYYLFEIKSKIMSLYDQHLITDEVKKELLQKLERSAEAYTDFETTFIHADVTPLNICIDKETKKIYLIDYDDFKIGDPLMDISRIINCRHLSKVFNVLVEKYYKDYEQNIRHLFYTLRVNVNWYNHIIEKKQEQLYDLNKAKQEVLDVIEKILKHNE